MWEDGNGVVVRDHNGCVWAAKCSIIHGRFDPTAAETMANIHALKFCMALDVYNICLEGDAKNVVDGLNSMEKNWSRMGHLVVDARNLFCWIKSLGN
jgi:ribonuclease HI